MRSSDLYSCRYIAHLPDDVGHKPRIRFFQGGAERGFGPPTEVEQHTRIQDFPGHTVGPGRIKAKPAAITDDVGNLTCQLGNRAFCTATEIDRFGPVVMVHDKHTGVGQVRSIDKFAAWFAGSPKDDLIM